MTRTKPKKIFHVQIKFHHTGWRLASQVYTKKTALKEKKKWQRLLETKRSNPYGLHKVRVVTVKKRTHGLAKISRSGKVVGWS